MKKNILTRSRFSIFILSASALITQSVQLQINIGSQSFNTDTVANYDSLIQAISSSQDPEIKTYSKELEELNQFILKSPGNLAHMIGPNLFISARHVFYQNGSMPSRYPFSPLESSHISVATAFEHPNPSYDLVLFTGYVYGNQTVEFEPLRRYYGSDLSGKDCFAISSSIHHQNGGLAAGSLSFSIRVLTENMGKLLHTKGFFGPGQNSPILFMNYSYNGPKIKANFYGGDSGSPVFIKVSNTGHPLTDYQYIGFNETGNPLKVVNIASPEISQWITNTIISIALGQDRPNRIHAGTPLEARNVAYNTTLYRTWFKRGLYQNTQGSMPPTRGGFLIDPSWMIGIKGQDFSDGQSTTIEKIKFNSLDEYMQRNRMTRTYPIKKVFDLGDGRSLALLKKPALTGVDDITVVNNQATIATMHDDLKVLKSFQTKWNNSGFNWNGDVPQHLQNEAIEWWTRRNIYRILFVPHKQPPVVVPDDLIEPLEKYLQEVSNLNCRIENIIIKEALSPS